MHGWEPIGASIKREKYRNGGSLSPFRGFPLREVLLGGMVVDHLSSAWEENEIEEGATVSLQLRKASLEEVVRDMVDLNPHLTVEELMERVTFEEDGCTLQSWDLFRKGLTALPESIGDLTLTSNLNLGGNQLTTLPESFGSLTVGRFLYLNENQLTTLPESFGSIRVGRNLDLRYNQLTTLPESFGELTVGRSLNLLENQLTTLPDNFGFITVGRNLNLKSNQLTSLPKSFNNVNGEVLISNNPLQKLK